MKAISLTDIKLRVFIDTNVLIDAFTTPVHSVKTFIEGASSHEQIDLVTSDYALWEHHEFIRQQTWIRMLVNQNRSYKEALKYRVRATQDIKDEIRAGLSSALQGRQDLGIENYNLMDEATQRGDFFNLLEHLTIETEISNQDLLILLSAYITQSTAILSRDGAFRREYSGMQNPVNSLEISLLESSLPHPLKELTFIGNLEKTPDQYYKEWFNRHFADLSIGRCISVYQQQNTLAIIVNEELHPIREEDYLLICKFDNSQFLHIVTQVRIDHLYDYDECVPVVEGTKVTVKLPDDLSADRWMNGAKVFLVDSN